MSYVEIGNISKTYNKNVHALKEISFTIQEGESIGILGESGSGKSTLAKILTGIEPATSGTITLDGESLNRKKRKLMSSYRKKVQMIFQDATSALNPRLRVEQSIIEPLSNYPDIIPSYADVSSYPKKRKEQQIVRDLLKMVGLKEEMALMYPDQLSGGQKQRVGIARAISLEPSLLVCDEPTASLDVTVQKQILDLLKALQNQHNMSILFISHDVRAVYYICTRIIVLKNGEMVDTFKRDELYDEARHPYTKSLIQAASVS
ncbi:peptide ABC transporter ATP-binding protein [Alkalihalophilus pseudofirmus]|uniref:ABC transporter ATP-binding protein n=1 Tax=Alkalihalophilus pseudofirmus TaxID=79885 RepID=UPI000952EBB6|nr:peptide ABC transporter ATP-binding protein [Alkalihalophilus pseudofirmus]